MYYVTVIDESMAGQRMGDSNYVHTLLGMDDEWDVWQTNDLHVWWTPVADRPDDHVWTPDRVRSGINGVTHCEYAHGDLRVLTWTFHREGETDVEIWQNGQYVETITI